MLIRNLAQRKRQAWLVALASGLTVLLIIGDAIHLPTPISTPVYNAYP